MSRKRRLLAAALLALGMAAALPCQAEAAGKKTIYNSPYVTFSPDGEAFTTCAGDQNYKWYDYGMTVDTGIASSLRSLETGEHYYKVTRYGEAPVGSWKVTHRAGMCIHNDYTDQTDWHGLKFGTSKCLRPYYSGWSAYCADCGGPVTYQLLYMSREAASTIHYLDLGSDTDPVSYYYFCPFCRNLEQGSPMSAHRCKEISWNQYRVVYQANAGKDPSGGYMGDSFHMYNNAVRYNGETVTPVTHLTKNTYTRIGYVFTGWNTKPDGSGTPYADGAEILNLSNADWNKEYQDTWTAGDNGTVTLYAQWRKSESTLVLDAAGGKYNGQDTCSFTRKYMESYVLQEGLIQAPGGYTVSFQTNGGSGVEPVTGTRHFSEWMRQQPFHGQFKDGKYLFTAPDKNVDTLKASYQADPITLPVTSRAGWSFGGWYYDPDFTLPAGGAGDQIIPSKDMTLYAQWVDLKLKSSDNYEANGGKGAVDLSWSQKDQKDKTYLVYQKREDGPWFRVNSADDISSTTMVERVYAFKGQAESYTIPYTGLYTLEALGAQGQDYESYAGGYGGSVSGTFWLRKGDVLTYTVGGQDGYNGGGSASRFGNGGGMTEVRSVQNGLLLIAGGGGGAFSHGDGKDGGSAESVIDGNYGEDGMAGGGAGYQGGTAGERIDHYHIPGCYVYHAHTGSSSRYGGCYTRYVENKVTQRWTDNLCCSNCQEGPHAHYPGNPYGACWSFNPNWERVVDNSYYALTCGMDTSAVVGYRCGLLQGQVLSSRQAFGGSNYVNTAYAQNYEDKSGVGRGDGSGGIHAKAIGYQESLDLSGVTAADLAAPDKIPDGVEQEALDAKTVRVAWEAPRDNGTVYYHKVETYLSGSTSVLSGSNITKNTMTSGVKGYYYLVDQKADTVVTDGAGYVEEPSVRVDTAKTVQYLHIAAVDVAGNISDTTHVRIDEEEVLWKIFTRQLSIDGSGGNVYPAAADKSWYVRADGSTPFTLRHEAYLEGTASPGYQLNETIYETVKKDGSRARNIVYTPAAEISDGSIRTDAEGLSYAVEGAVVLQQYPYSYTVRSDRNRGLAGVQKFTIAREMSGQEIQVIPIAGADKAGEKVYSDYEADGENKITLIADGEGPEISGLEGLENRDLIDRRDGGITLAVTAWDALSGVKEWYVQIVNLDNTAEQIYWPDETGGICIEITEDTPLFSGDFTVTAYAVDQVGNVTERCFGTTEFSLETEIQRVLEPHDPLFRCGESGVLTFSVWGYADRVEVEFPAEMTALDPGLNRVFLYEDLPAYLHREQIVFMIPLDTPANKTYEITVRAYKGDRKLEESPSLGLLQVDGTVLDEFRTRLR